MTQLIKINMLPYREQLEQQKKAQFKRLMLLAALVGIGLGAFTYITLGSLISNQESRNDRLEQGIKGLEDKIAQVNQLEVEKANFLARKQKVEELENKRFEAARMIDSLNAIAPEGVYLTGIIAKDATNYTLTGQATSDSRIADFMRAIPTTNVFAQPSLDSIEKTGEAQKFSLSVAITNAAANATTTNGQPAIVPGNSAQAAQAVNAAEQASAASAAASQAAPTTTAPQTAPAPEAAPVPAPAEQQAPAASRPQ